MVLQFGFSSAICDAAKHYIDGLFFSELAVLLAVMMVYKYWDSITVCSVFPNTLCKANSSISQREDLEFSVGSKQAVWEVKDPLLSAGPGYPGSGASDEGLGSDYHGHGGYNPPNANYGGYGGKTASLVGGVSGTQLYQQKSGYGGGGNGGRGYPPSSGGY